MKEKYKGKTKILIAFGILFLVVSVLLALIFLDSKKSYTVTFDLDGGILLNGSLEQHVLQGQDVFCSTALLSNTSFRVRTPFLPLWLRTAHICVDGARLTGA